MTDTAGPTLGDLRWAGPTLATQRLSTGLAQALQQGAALERYHLTAQALGAPRDAAVEILHETQGARAGSTPSDAELSAATERLPAYTFAGAVPMSDALRAVVHHLAATTRYGRTDLAEAVAALRGINEPRPDEWIEQALPATVEMAARSPYRLADVAQSVREATTWTT
jgi:hypothetical protein